MAQLILMLVVLTFGAIPSASALKSGKSTKSKRNESISKTKAYDLYLEKSGIKLKEVLSAIDGNKDAQKKLQKFTLSQDSMQVITDLREQANQTKENCTKHTRSADKCATEIAPYVAEIDQLQESAGKSSSPKMANNQIYWYLIVLNSVVEREVLSKLLEEWDKTCAKAGKMNEPTCQDSLQSITDLSELMLGFVSLHSTTLKKSASHRLDKNQIKNLVASYEN